MFTQAPRQVKYSYLTVQKLTQEELHLPWNSFFNHAPMPTHCTIYPPMAGALVVYCGQQLNVFTTPTSFHTYSNYHTSSAVIKLTLLFMHGMRTTERPGKKLLSLGLCLLCRHNFGNNVHIRTWGIARNNVYTCGKTWVRRTHKSIHTMHNVMVYCCRAPV